MDIAQTQKLDVVAVGAHPDDVEIGCGGTLARLASLGYRVAIVDLTDGEPTPDSPGPQVRLAEAQRAAEILAVQFRKTLKLPNRLLFDSFEARVVLAKFLRTYRPKVVLGLAGKTVMASPDHYQAMLITDAAVFYSRLSKWEAHFAELEPHSISNQFSYSLAMRDLGQPEQAGSLVADISDTLETKLSAIRAYQTQFPPRKEHVFRLIESMNRYHGQTAGFEAGELFTTHRSIGTDDLMKIACPNHVRQG